MEQKIMEQLELLRKNREAVNQLMSSPDGQRLLALLSSDGGARLRQASEAAEKGNTADVVHMIADIMRTPEGAEIVRKINGKANIM
jgi:phage baseplate assembly protein W